MSRRVNVFIDGAGVVQEYIKGGLLTEHKIYETVNRIKARGEQRTASLR